MTQQWKRYSTELKAKVPLEAIRGHKTANEIASMYGVLCWLHGRSAGHLAS